MRQSLGSQTLPLQVKPLPYDSAKPRWQELLGTSLAYRSLPASDVESLDC